LNIVVFSSIPWGFLWQRPQHIASNLAKKGHNVIYFENPVYVSSAASFQQRIKKKSFLDVKQINPNLTVITIYAPPFRGKLSSFKNRLTKFYFEYSLKKLAFKADVALIYCLDFVPLLKTLNSMNVKVAFDFVDDLLSFPEYAYTKFERMQTELLQTASVVFATSEILCKISSVYNNRSIYLPNAMDFNHFNPAATQQVNPELSTLSHPLIGYIGAFSNWVDDELVFKLAEKHPEYNVVLVGPIYSGKERFLKYSNIIMLGTKSYEQLPSYLSNMDVCLIPFKINSITLAANPIKMYEYLAAGKPVVSTNLPEVQSNASEVVYIGQNQEDFISKVEQAVNEPKDESIIQRRMNFARENSWENRVNQIEKHLKEITANEGRVVFA
jgi:glycosyltransferase involved in cell wall biosynthesis